MECELCGKVSNCKPAVIDGVRMMVCSDCMKYGTGIKTEEHVEIKKPMVMKIKKPKEEDIYKEMNRELVPNWNIIIRNARERKGLTREELGFKVGERTVTISKIEKGELRPSDKTIEKLEKELNIKLLEEIPVKTQIQTRRSSTSLTLGDFIKKEE